MIRVNLLTSVQDRTTIVDGRLRTGPSAAAVALPGLALVLAAWWFWSLHGQAAELTRGLADAEAALAGLTPVVDAVHGAEALRADLAAQVARIEALHDRRDDASRLLDGLSRVLPDGLWLSEVRQEPAAVVVRGRAFEPAAVSDYAAALEDSAFPDARVEVVGSRREASFGGRGAVAFEVRMRLPSDGNP